MKKNILMKCLVVFCIIKSSIIVLSDEKGAINKEQQIMLSKDTGEKIQGEYNEEEVVLIKVNVKKKEEYVHGIIKNGKIYIEKDVFLEAIEIKNKSKLKNILEVDGKKYFDLEEQYKQLGLKSYSFDQEEMSIRVVTPWGLEYEKEEEILDARERLIAQSKITYTKEKEYKTEEWKMWTSGIMGIGYTRSDGETEDNSGYIRYTNNFLYGSTSLNATIEDNDGDANTVLDYIYWERNVLENKRLLVGNTYKQYPYSLSDKGNSITGVTLGLENSWDSQMRVTQKKVVGYAPTGTTVELYENGILKDFQTVTDGQYEFNVDLYTGSKNYSIKKYMPDGQIITEDVTLLASETVLPKGKMDYSVDIGVIKEKESKNTMGGQVKYGILEDFTGILGGFDLYDDQYNKQSFYTVGEVGILNVPYINIPFYHNVMYSSDGEENSMSKYIVGMTFGDDNIRYRKEDYTNLDERFQSYTRKSDDLFYDIREIKGYNLKIGTSSLEDIDKEKERTYYGNISKSYGQFYVNTGLNKTKNETTGETQTYASPGVSYSISSANEMSKYLDTISVYSNVGEDNTYGISIGKNNGGEWDYYVNYNNSDKNEESFGLMVSYIPGGKAKISTNIQKSNSNNRPSIQNTVETNVYMGVKKPKFDYTKNMGKGTIEGKVYLDREGNGKFDEGVDSIIKNSKIETYRNSTHADENGEFVLGGLETYSPVDIRVSSAQDEDIPYYVGEKSHEKIKLNPGGRKKLEFGYRPTVSITSEINFGENFYREQVIEMLKDMDIEFENMRTHEKYKYEFGKDDIIIKTLPVGVYSLELTYKGDSNIKIHKSRHYLVLKETEESEISFDVDKLDENNFVLTVKQDYKQIFVSLEQLYSSLELEKNKYIGYGKKEVERR